MGIFILLSAAQKQKHNGNDIQTYIHKKEIYYKKVFDNFYKKNVIDIVLEGQIFSKYICWWYLEFKN